VTEHQIAGAALFVFATHPLTWLLIYAFVEGGVRLVGAAFTEDVRGTFPLYLFERVLFFATHREEARRMARETRQHFAAVFQGLRERALMARLPDVPDELLYTRNPSGEILEVFACRRKEDWTPPKIVLVDKAYYRLEDASVEKGPRPFRYRLRRLEAGVPGRNVIVYERSKAVGRRD
jgi:hypothetical protein